MLLRVQTLELRFQGNDFGMKSLIVPTILCYACFLNVSAYRFVMPGRLFKEYTRRNIMSSDASQDIIRSRQEELYRSALESESYEYEYDGKKMTYTPDKTACANLRDTVQLTSASMLTQYVASEGLESIITSRGVDKPLLPLEYEVAFKLFPRLRQAAHTGIWPDPANITQATAAVIHSCVLATAPEAPNEATKTLPLPPFWQRTKNHGPKNSVSNATELDIRQLSEVLRQVTDSRNATMCQETLLDLGIQFERYMRFFPSSIPADADEEVSQDNYELHFDLFALGIEWLDDVLSHTTLSANAPNQEKRMQYYTQDLLLRVFRMVLVILKAEPLPGEKVVFSYGGFLLREEEGK